MIKKNKKKPYKKFVFGGLFFCLIGALAYFLIWSPFFWVKEIKILTEKEPMYYSFTEIEEIAGSVLENKFLNLIPQKSVVLVSTKEIEKNILERFSEISLVDVVKKATFILEITIEERKSIGIWCRRTITNSQQIAVEKDKTSSNDEDENKNESDFRSFNEKWEVGDCFKIDKDGVIFRESPLIGGNLVLSIYSENKSAEIRDEIIPPKVMDFILTAQKELSKIKTNGKVFSSAHDFEFISSEELRATTIQGWQIYFNPAVSANLQIDALKAILNNETKENLSNLKYVDLRIEGRVYYK